MLDLNRILVIIDPDAEEQPALERGIQLARYGNSELELLQAEYNAYLEDGFYFDPLQAQKLRLEHCTAQRQRLEAMAQPLRDEGLVVSVATAWGNPPYMEIVDRVKDSKPSLVIKSARHHNKIARLLLSNEDWELVRYCPAPLLLVKNGPWPANPVFVAAVDPNHIHDKPAALDEKIIASAQGVSTIAGGDVHLFHSAFLPPLSGVYPLRPDPEKEVARLEALGKAHDISASHCHWSDEDVLHALPAKVAELEANAVVMGAVSRSRVDRILIGNTAEKVMDRLECDLLVVKPDQAEAP